MARRLALRSSAALLAGTSLLALALLANAGTAAVAAQRPAMRIGGVVPAHLGSRLPGRPVVYHGGPVMQPKSVTYAIYWVPATLQNGDPTHISSTYQSLLTRYFHDIGGSPYYNISTQYYQTVGGQRQYIVNKSTFGRTIIDSNPYPASGCTDSVTPGNCITDAQLQAEIARVIDAEGLSPALTKQFFVFTGFGEGSCFDTGSSCAYTVYCAYHGSFTHNSTDVIYANIPYPTTGSSTNNCVHLLPGSPNGDIEADGAINVVAHEHGEAVSDPLLNAWYGAAGYEDMDKCAWKFGDLNYAGGTANELWNGHPYIVQMNWSNDGLHCVQTYP